MANTTTPTLYELNASASAILDIISQNNPAGVIFELKRIGYDAYDINDAKYHYLQLYLLNSDEFWNSIKNIQFNYRNATPDTEAKVKQLTQKLGGEDVKSQTAREANTGSKKWWQTALDVLIGHQVSGGGSTIEPPKTPNGAYIAFAAIAIVIGVIIWVVVVKMK